ncbi:MAG TPA: D-alanyl-D-alanine carboxypeptidase/D-alanyl-D-alanine-endopeptidase [Candidatus Binatia bacterium]|nr:D-alanyl-D-alanine carboxypeptidase/D-alanyl-D-alanine-endopeptidase [Candidatus Binatia bacterium]
MLPISRVSKALLAAAALALCARGWAQTASGKEASPASLAARIRGVTERPDFRHSHFGIEFLSLDDGSVVFEQNSGKLFVPGSTTKLLTEGTTLALLGADYRFHTRVYRTGRLGRNETLEGDLILVASGDPNLSNRIQPDGTLAFENHDHSYGGSPDTRAVPGDPLAVLREIAGQVARQGIRRIKGRVVVDASLYPEGNREGGTGVVISPIMVNDNVIDITVEPGRAEGAPAVLRASPSSAYASFASQIQTGSPSSKLEMDIAGDVTNPDGSHTVTVTGSVPLGSPAILFAYPVPEPRRFAEVALRECLWDAGVKLEPRAAAAPPEFKSLAASYTEGNLVAEHVSPPLSEEIKVTLKVSQNLHASSMPYLWAALLAHKADPGAGFDLEHNFLAGAGLDLSGAAQSDGAGADAFYTPDFMVHYLAFLARQKYFQVFYKALPILGRDGTLWNIQPEAPAAGQVHAKTGTYVVENALNKDLMLTGKGLAGYLTTVDGRHLAFALYVNLVPLSRDDPDAGTKVAGQALGEIAAAAYDSPR